MNVWAGPSDECRAGNGTEVSTELGNITTLCANIKKVYAARPKVLVAIAPTAPNSCSVE